MNAKNFTEVIVGFLGAVLTLVFIIITIGISFKLAMLVLALVGAV